MQQRHLRKKLLPTLIGAIAAGSISLNTNAQQDIAELEEIIVTGSYSRSLQSAIDAKRNAPSVTDAIIAQDIGQFPAQNIAEALQRVTGVSIVRDRGEGVYVRVRGLGSNFQVTTLNNRTMAVNENVRTSGQFGRQFRFDTLPAELVSAVEVIKSPTAAHDEGAIGGTVNVKTFRPLELGETTFSASARASHAQLAEETDPRFSGLANWVNEDQTFGLLVSSAYAERSVRQDRAINFGWTELEEGLDTDGDGTRDSGPLITPGGVRPTLELEDRERFGLSTAMQWRPSDNLDINLDLLYVDQEVQYDEFTYSADYDPASLVPGTAIIRDGALVGGTITDGSVQIGRESSGIHDENLSIGLNAEWLVDDWTLSGDLFHSSADSEDSDPIRRTRFRVTEGIGFSFLFPKVDGDSVPSIEYANADLNDPSQWPGRRLEWRTIRANDEEQSLQFDASRSIQLAGFTEFATGIKFRERTRDYFRRDLRLSEGVEGETFDSSYFTAFPADDFLGNANGSLPQVWLVPDEDKFWSNFPSAELLAADLTSGDLGNSYRIEESIRSAYAMLNLDSELASMPLRGNLGVRVAQTEQVSSGHATVDGESTPVSFSNEYTDVLPSVNFALDLRDDLITRVAAAKVITRADLQDMAPRLTFNSGDILTATGGNPNLEPFEAWQYDATLEWYPQESTALTAGVFYKDISTFIQTQISDLEFNGEVYRLTSKVNGSNAEVSGLELAYQQVFNTLPAPFDGLGVQANYTLTDSSAVYVDGDERIKGELEDVAKNSYNLTAFYEKNGLALRFSYSWRDGVLNQIGTNSLASENNAEFGSLDFSAAYDLSESTSLFIEGINVTNEVQQLFVDGDEFRSYTDYGRTFVLGARVKL
ncbi:TonB-dependent receptor [Microbulbifer harenosus]|uniref:TonB-dependent receptor n=1 Tax=Microbulbifer harenosus TaxID=2576840 RepID=A0ABY2UI77_9GAMM|nr:TonB-dependent receptor [Microbulbifer harenosus]TLM76750.1 TonB-dependent receptor [Microbulbifer harenosus]